MTDLLSRDLFYAGTGTSTDDYITYNITQVVQNVKVSICGKGGDGWLRTSDQTACAGGSAAYILYKANFSYFNAGNEYRLKSIQVGCNKAQGGITGTAAIITYAKVSDSSLYTITLCAGNGDSVTSRTTPANGGLCYVSSTLPGFSLIIQTVTRSNSVVTVTPSPNPNDPSGGTDKNPNVAICGIQGGNNTKDGSKGVTNTNTGKYDLGYTSAGAGYYSPGSSSSNVDNESYPARAMNLVGSNYVVNSKGGGFNNGSAYIASGYGSGGRSGSDSNNIKGTQGFYELLTTDNPFTITALTIPANSASWYLSSNSAGNIVAATSSEGTYIMNTNANLQTPTGKYTFVPTTTMISGNMVKVDSTGVYMLLLSGNRLYYSSNSGVSFTILSITPAVGEIITSIGIMGGPPDSNVNINSGSVIYFMTEIGTTYKYYYSNNSGATFSNIPLTGTNSGIADIMTNSTSNIYMLMYPKTFKTAANNSLGSLVNMITSGLGSSTKTVYTNSNGNVIVTGNDTGNNYIMINDTNATNKWLSTGISSKLCCVTNNYVFAIVNGVIQLSYFSDIIAGNVTTYSTIGSASSSWYSLTASYDGNTIFASDTLGNVYIGINV